MARAMSALGDVKPKARRVISRILVLMDSILPLESPCSMQARIAVRYFTMLRCSFTNEGMRQRRAQPTDFRGLRWLRRRGSLKITRRPSFR